jgi:hypothetical protein
MNGFELQTARTLFWRRWGKWIVVLAVVVAVGGWAVWYKGFREVPQHFATMEEAFKYGSIGTEPAQGLPYWIWQVLPRIFPEYLPRPGGYNALGLFSEPGRPTPVGFTVKTVGFERVGINCALCHSQTLRYSPNESPVWIPGGPNHTLDVQGYQRFLFQCAEDPRFTSSTILAEIGKVYSLSIVDRLLYRFLLIPATRRALIEQKASLAWTFVRPLWGPGRIDPFNNAKFAMLKVPVGDTIGNSDLMSVWNMKARPHGAFHWDGLLQDFTEVVRSSALGDGATPTSIPLNDLQKLQDWMLDLKAPKYPVDHFPIDAAKAAAGKTVYAHSCAACHAEGGAHTGQVIPQAEVGTDPHREQEWTLQAAEAYNAYAKSYPWKFNTFRSTGGYLAIPLDGLWARGPYLHNGSVPNLRELLLPPKERSKVFYRGYDVFDSKNVGFVSQGPDAVRAGWRFVTSEAGNSNEGHTWGTDLSAKDKDSLIEYLKTL